MITHTSELLARRASGEELSITHDRELEQHLQVCAECRQLQRDLDRAESLLRSREPAVDPGPLTRPAPHVIGILGRVGAATAIIALAALAGSVLGSLRAGGPSDPQAGSPQAAILSPSPNLATPSAAVSVPSLQPATPPASIPVVPSSTPSSTAAPAAACEVADGQGTEPGSSSRIEVCPGAGRVGQTMTVTATNCGYPDQLVILYFGSEGGNTTGTFGSKELGRFEPDGSGRVQMSFAIPAELDPLRGSGGGPTAAGTYRVYSKPTVCEVIVRVQ
jgi:hypothetical protein